MKEFLELKNHIFKAVSISVEYDDITESNIELFFHRMDGKVFKFYHDQCCCEKVYIGEIVGDFLEQGLDAVQDTPFTKTPY